MKDFTMKDAYKLREDFERYCERAEQHEFIVLAILQSNMNRTIEKAEKQTEKGEEPDWDSLKKMDEVVRYTIGGGR